MKFFHAPFRLLLVVSLLFCVLGITNIGISLSWDFTNIENLFLGLFLLFIGIASFYFRRSLIKKKPR
ncbi:hypothetical protein MCOL2_11025 [Listeria fleischmannii FSL S10-1203]|uniref:Uncharacterized protein n=1 Tax=Listeria fleischmannii FSL S10-1203 TaxID=1265822 RepID=W7DE48_9LIST|nr:hypothetical protein MCOL2_11025 [Listeria fleischmannii FSL S10-1203]